jgi:hypothetical protein
MIKLFRDLVVGSVILGTNSFYDNSLRTTFWMYEDEKGQNLPEVVLAPLLVLQVPYIDIQFEGQFVNEVMFKVLDCRGKIGYCSSNLHRTYEVLS